MSEKIKCPYCGNIEEHDFCEMNDQDGEYDIECESCLNEFQITNSWERVIDVNGDLCVYCDLFRSLCKC